jgi:3-hydroxymyristoyl/3-hydroxydecanoyl-(acyl carrier protein) dehydratase
MDQPKTDILSLIPQRPPVVMVDRLVECTEGLARSSFYITKDNIFVSDGRFSAAGILENMAQTAAARTGWLGRQGEVGANKTPSIGVIGSVSNARFHLEPEAGMELLTTVIVDHEIFNASIISARTEVQGKLAAEATLKIFLTEDQSV